MVDYKQPWLLVLSLWLSLYLEIYLLVNLFDDDLTNAFDHTSS